MAGDSFSWVDTVSETEVSFLVDTRVYPISVLFRTAYAFTYRSFVYLENSAEHVVKVFLATRSANEPAARIAGEFLNDLIDQKVRHDIAEDTRAIRELIVTQAFAEADLLDRSSIHDDYDKDPRGITK